jgi:anti-repressor protein
VLASAEGDMSVREAAFVLNRDPMISTGQNRLFNKLKELGWIDRHNVPYAAHERHVRLRVYSYEDRDSGESHTRQQVRVTAEGLRLLHKRLGGTSPLSHLMPVDPPAA